MAGTELQQELIDSIANIPSLKEICDLLKTKDGVTGDNYIRTHFTMLEVTRGISRAYPDLTESQKDKIRQVSFKCITNIEIHFGLTPKEPTPKRKRSKDNK